MGCGAGPVQPLLVISPRPGPTSRPEEGAASSSRTTVSQRSAVRASQAVTVKATCVEATRISRVANTVPSAPTLKSLLLLSYCVPSDPEQLLNRTAEKDQRVSTGQRPPTAPQWPLSAAPSPRRKALMRPWQAGWPPGPATRQDTLPGGSAAPPRSR